MMKSKIPVPSKSSVSSIPVPVKTISNTNERKAKQQQLSKTTVKKEELIKTKQIVKEATSGLKTFQKCSTITKKSKRLSAAKISVNKSSNYFKPVLKDQKPQLNITKNSQKVVSSEVKKFSYPTNANKGQKIKHPISKLKSVKAAENKLKTNSRPLQQSSTIKTNDKKINKRELKSSSSSLTNSSKIEIISHTAPETTFPENKLKKTEKMFPENKLKKIEKMFPENRLKETKKTFPEKKLKKTSQVASKVEICYKDSEELSPEKQLKEVSSLLHKSCKVKITSRDVAEIDKKIAVVNPLKNSETEKNLGENDFEFQASGFYKNLILSERELSPGIMKLCADKKLSSNPEKMRTPLQTLLSGTSSSNFVEDLRRNSAKFLGRKGRFHVSPSMEKMGTPLQKLLNSHSSSNFVEELRRNSAKFLERKGRSQVSPSIATFKTPTNKILFSSNSSTRFVDDLRRNSGKFSKLTGRSLISPHLMDKASPFKISKDVLSLKELLNTNSINEMRKILEPKRKVLEKSDYGSENYNFANRRWTSNNQSVSNFSKTSAGQFGSDIRRLSEMQGKSLLKQQCKNVLQEYNKPLDIDANQENFDLPHKKKEKAKKKVTFKIPFASSPDSVSDLHKPKENCAKKAEIFGMKENLPKSEISEDNRETKPILNAKENTSKNSTPELTLTSCKLKTDQLSANVEPETLKPECQNATPEFDLKSVEHLSKDFKISHSSGSISPLSTNVPAITVSNNEDNIIDRNVFRRDCITPCWTKSSSEALSECLSEPPSQSSFLVHSLETLNLTSSPQCASETKGFSFHLRRNIFTPIPISLTNHQSASVDSLSPEFMVMCNIEALDYMAPIQTPYVLKSLAQTYETSLSSVRQKLNFNVNEELKLSNERRESQIILHNIPTAHKMQDILCDQECNILSMQSTDVPICRPLMNPIASILNNGDEMHFVPLNSSP